MTFIVYDDCHHLSKWPFWERYIWCKVPVINKESNVVDIVIDYGNSISTCDMWPTNTKSHLDTSSPRLCYCVISLVVNLHFSIIILSVGNNEFSESCCRSQAKSYSYICLFIFMIYCPKGWSKNPSFRELGMFLIKTISCPKKHGGTKLVINLNRLNEFIPPQHVVCWVTGPTCWWFDISCLWYNGISHKVKSCLPFWVSVLYVFMY